MTRNALATAYVNRQADAAHLLEMLGLTVDGIPQPDDTRVYGMDSGSPVAGTRPGIESSHYADRPKLSTAPVSLQVLAPVIPIVAAPKPSRTSGVANLLKVNKSREAPCGTPSAKKRHKRRGEPICDLCAPVTDWHPNHAKHKRDARRRAGIMPRPPVQPCGTEAAYRRHKKAKEPTCQPCREARRDADRARVAARGIAA